MIVFKIPYYSASSYNVFIVTQGRLEPLESQGPEGSLVCLEMISSSSMNVQLEMVAVPRDVMTPLILSIVTALMDMRLLKKHFLVSIYYNTRRW